MVKKTEERARAELDMWLSNDWELIEDTPLFYLLKKNTQSLMGHILVIVFFWWTFGLANLIYYFASKKTKKILK